MYFWYSGFIFMIEAGGWAWCRWLCISYCINL